MSKKMMLLALSVVSVVLFALPAVASANLAHISAAETFTISGGATKLEDINGKKVTCETVTGHGTFVTTTTGHLRLTFHGCKDPESGIKCNSSGQEAGTIETTLLPFDLITFSGSGGVLITPNTTDTGVNHFVTFNCTIFVKKEVRGTGVIGTITSPECGKSSTTATLKFEEGTTTGLQKHTTFTGVEYHLLSNGTKAAQEGEGQIHFAAPKTITCT